MKKLFFVFMMSFSFLKASAYDEDLFNRAFDMGTPVQREQLLDAATHSPTMISFLAQEILDAAEQANLAKVRALTLEEGTPDANPEQDLDDEAFARAIAMADGSFGLEPMPVDLRSLFTEYDLLYKAISQDTDVHKHNSLVKLGATLAAIIPQDIFSNPTMLFAETRDTLIASEDYQDYAKKDVLKTNLAALAAHLTTNKVEVAESGTNVEELFSRVWSFAIIDPSRTRQLFDSLCDNTETGGGCYPGHSGRLGRLYLSFIRNQWAE
jgi:hypothetical protein